MVNLIMFFIVQAADVTILKRRSKWNRMQCMDSEHRKLQTGQVLNRSMRGFSKTVVYSHENLKSVVTIIK